MDVAGGVLGAVALGGRHLRRHRRGDARATPRGGSSACSSWRERARPGSSSWSCAHDVRCWTSGSCAAGPSPSRTWWRSPPTSGSSRSSSSWPSTSSSWPGSRRSATALDFVPMTVLMIGGSAVAGRWVARSGPRIPMAIGCAAAGIGILVVDGVLGSERRLRRAVVVVGAGRRRLRHRARAGRQRRDVVGGARAVGHGGFGHEHQSRARRRVRGRGARGHRQRAADRQPDSEAQLPRHPRQLPVGGDRRGDPRGRALVVQPGGEEPPRGRGRTPARRQGHRRRRSAPSTRGCTRRCSSRRASCSPAPPWCGWPSEASPMARPTGRPHLRSGCACWSSPRWSSCWSAQHWESSG